MTDLHLLRLLQLASPALPVGAYSYSQGLECAVEDGTVKDRASACRWIRDCLTYNVGALEAPVWWRLYHAWKDKDRGGAAHWNEWFCASRECAESRAETLQMGYSLARLLAETGAFEAGKLEALLALDAVSFPAAFSFAAAAWEIPPRPALLAYLWAWLENQVNAALRTVPLGQVAGQGLLLELGAELPGVVECAASMTIEEISNLAPGLAIAGSRHETQYSRLFRS